MSFEKHINNNFKKNLGVAMNLIFNKTKNLEVVDKILGFLKTFNDSLKNTSEEEINFIFDVKEIQENLDNFDNNFNLNKKTDEDNHYRKNISASIPLQDIFNIDYFNVLNIYDINYILFSICITKDNSLIIFPNPKNINFFKNYFVKKNPSKTFNLEKNNNISIDPNLVKKSLLALGDEETDKIIHNFNRTKELSFLKYEMEYKYLIKELNEKINKCMINIKENKVILQLNNINYFARNKLFPKEKLQIKIKNEFPNYNKDKLLEAYYTIDYLYNFRHKRKLILNNYQKEINEVKSQTEQIVEDGINNEINLMKENIENVKKEEIEILHMRNKEIFDIKQNIKNEKNAQENEKLKIDKEKREKELIDYYGEIKKISDIFNVNKKQQIYNEMKLQKNMIKMKEKIRKDEVKLKLPIIEQRQKVAETQFVKLQKQKETIKEENIKRQINLNKIIENLKARPKVEIDPDRAKQITEALKIRYETKRDDGDRIVLFENHGFTVDNLMKDMRYKISTALGEAGLLSSAYSNTVLNALNQPKTDTKIN